MPSFPAPAAEASIGTVSPVSLRASTAEKVRVSTQRFASTCAAFSGLPASAAIASVRSSTRSATSRAARSSRGALVAGEIVGAEGIVGGVDRSLDEVASPVATRPTTSRRRGCAPRTTDRSRATRRRQGAVVGCLDGLGCHGDHPSKLPVLSTFPLRSRVSSGLPAPGREVMPVTSGPAGRQGPAGAILIRGEDVGAGVKAWIYPGLRTGAAAVASSSRSPACLPNARAAVTWTVTGMLCHELAYEPSTVLDGDEAG